MMVIMPRKSSSSTMQNINVDQLIIDVHMHPSLYDPEDPQYRDPETTNYVWASIGSLFGVPGEECKAKWKMLRDTYVKKKKLLKIRSGKAATRVSRWKYLQSMSFLDPYLQERSTAGNYELDSLVEFEASPSDDQDNEDEDEDENERTNEPEEKCDKKNGNVQKKASTKEEPCTPSAVNLSAMTCSTTTPPTGRPVKRPRYQENHVDSLVQMMINKTEVKLKDADTQTDKEDSCTSTPPPDEDEHFMMSQLGTLRRLPPAQKALAKFRIHEMLFKMENNLYENQEVTVPHQKSHEQIETCAHTVGIIQKETSDSST